MSAVFEIIIQVLYRFTVIYVMINFARNNSVIQEHLFDHMDDLLQLDVAIPDMAGLLTEVSQLF